MSMMGNNLVLTHLFLVDSSTLSMGRAHIQIKAVWYTFFIFSILNRNICKQAVQVLIRCHIL